MKDNRLSIIIKKPVSVLFHFLITPPNSKYWVPHIIDEQTNEWPAKTGTVYIMQDKDGVLSEVVIRVLKPNEMIEWVALGLNYHCRYFFRPIDRNTTEFTYLEWVDVGDIPAPFTQDVLEKLKAVVENSPS